eukprot:m51a1_g2203 hypothetical protein (530) ;mRNA; f:166190-168563
MALQAIDAPGREYREVAGMSAKHRAAVNVAAAIRDSAEATRGRRGGAVLEALRVVGVALVDGVLGRSRRDAGRASADCDIANANVLLSEGHRVAIASECGGMRATEDALRVHQGGPQSGAVGSASLATAQQPALCTRCRPACVSHGLLGQRLLARSAGGEKLRALVDAGAPEANAWYWRHLKSLGEYHKFSVAVLDPLAQDLTFPISQVPLTVAAATALVHLYRHNLYSEELPPEDVPEIEALERAIDAQLSTLGAKSFFVRLSSRSPKDAVLYPMKGRDTPSDRVVASLRARLRTVYGGVGPATVEQVRWNDEYTAMTQAALEALRVTCAREAVQLLSHSERAFRDIHLALEFPKIWSLSVVVRPWVDLDSATELRAFVKAGHMTALSQYDNYAYLERWQDPAQRDLTAQAVRQMFEERVRPRLADAMRDTDFVIDFGYDRDGRLWVIEVNAWGKRTGCACFSWKQDIDVLSGAKPFEFRVTTDTNPTHNYTRFLDPEWIALIERCRPPAAATAAPQAAAHWRACNIV